MVGEPSSEIVSDNNQNTAASGTGQLPESNTQDSDSLAAYVEKMKDKHQLFDRFCHEFEINPHFGKITTTITNSDGTKDTIEINAYPDDPIIESTNLDSEKPVHFALTKSNLTFRRQKPISEIGSENQSSADSNEIIFDFSSFDNSPVVEELDEKASRGDGDTQEKILTDLQNKFTALGMPEIPIIPYAHRLLNRTGYVQSRSTYQKAELIMPLYRTLEIKRLLTDPTNPNVDHLSIVTRRQHVYNQLMSLYRENGMSPEEIARKLIEGVYDNHAIAGVPVFSIGEDHFVVIDCAFSGYDEKQPTNSGFEGSVVDRPHSQVSDILEKAKAQGYITFYDNSAVSGGIHHHWQWHGIKINDYDKDHPENNLPKVIKILQDVGINPEEAASTIDTGSLTDLYMK